MAASTRQGIGVVGVYVHDQDEALAFYVDKVGFEVHTDLKNGPFRWLTVNFPERPELQLGLFAPGAPLHDPATERALRELVAKGAMPGLVLHVEDCRAHYERMLKAGVEFTQAPVERFGNVDAGFRDPSGNGWKMIELGRGDER
jgi:catechol 2,3-dioxygenase-like lactoylglutathione lyase family enzyme